MTSEEKKFVIGKHFNETSNIDWLGHWPVVDENGIIHGTIDGDTDIDGYTLLDDELQPVEEGEHFDAVLDTNGYLGA